MQVKIDSKTTPLLASFEQYAPVTKLLDDGEKLKFKAFQSSKHEDDKLIIGKTRHVLFNAQLKKQKQDRVKRAVKYAIGVLDEKTSKIKMIPVDKVFALQQTIKRADIVNSEVKDKIADLQRAEKRKLNHGHVEGMGKTIKLKNTFKQNLTASAEILTMLPSGTSLEATTPDSIYPSLVTSSISKHLTTDIVKRLYKLEAGDDMKRASQSFYSNDDNISANAIPSFLLEHIVDKGATFDEDQWKLVEYTRLLFIYKYEQKRLAGRMSQNQVTPVIPKSILMVFTKLFAGGHGRMTDSQVLKLGVYVAIACLQLFNYKVPEKVVRTLASDLRETPREVWRWGAVAGCEVKSGELVLKAPYRTRGVVEKKTTK